MDKTYLPDLISGLEQELLRLGYTKGSMTFYRRRRNQLMAYAEDRGECYYTEQLPERVLRDHAGRFLKDTAAGRNTGNPCSPYGWGFPAPPCGAAALSQA